MQRHGLIILMQNWLVIRFVINTCNNDFKLAILHIFDGHWRLHCRHLHNIMAVLLLYHIIVSRLFRTLIYSISKGPNMKLFFLSGLVRSEYMYTVNVASQSTWVNLGDNYVAYCNIPGLESQEILNNLEFRWYHNSQQVTKLWKVVSSKLA